MQITTSQVCLHCDGDGCDDCRHSGRRWTIAFGIPRIRISVRLTGVGRLPFSRPPKPPYTSVSDEAWRAYREGFIDPMAAPAPPRGC
jgi:hypothetical protein